MSSVVHACQTCQFSVFCWLACVLLFLSSLSPVFLIFCPWHPSLGTLLGLPFLQIRSHTPILWCFVLGATWRSVRVFLVVARSHIFGRTVKISASENRAFSSYNPFKQLPCSIDISCVIQHV